MQSICLSQPRLGSGPRIRVSKLFIIPCKRCMKHRSLHLSCCDSDISFGLPPSWMSDSNQDTCAEEGSKLGSASQAKCAFPNDGSFLQQFLSSSSRGIDHSHTSGLDEESACSEPVQTSTDLTSVGLHTTQKDENQPSVKVDQSRTLEDSKSKKSLLAAFSTKKKEVLALIKKACIAPWTFASVVSLHPLFLSRHNLFSVRSPGQTRGCHSERARDRGAGKEAKTRRVSRGDGQVPELFLQRRRGETCPGEVKPCTRATGLVVRPVK